jgi:hypothetical protein
VRPLYRNLLVIAALAPLLVLGAYTLTFGPASSWTLARKQEDWAQFGEYVGGALGAIYGFLAFVGLLATINIQISQGKLVELQRLLGMIAANIDAILNAEPRSAQPELKDRIEQTGLRSTVGQILSSIGSTAMNDSIVPSAILRAGYIAQASQHMMPESFDICIELNQLVVMLRAYAIAGGDSDIFNFYIMRYGSKVAFLEVSGLLNSPPIAEFFGARAAIERMRTDAAALVAARQALPSASLQL